MSGYVNTVPSDISMWAVVNGTHLTNIQAIHRFDIVGSATLGNESMSISFLTPISINQDLQIMIRELTGDPITFTVTKFIMTVIGTD